MFIQWVAWLRANPLGPVCRTAPHPLGTATTTHHTLGSILFETKRSRCGVRPPPGGIQHNWSIGAGIPPGG